MYSVIPVEDTGIRDSILSFIGEFPLAACFTPVLYNRLGSNGVSRDRIESELNALDNERRVIVRDHYCADPHLEGLDLRTVALVGAVEADTAAPGDPVSDAFERGESLWAEWLDDYLRNHQCE